MASQRDTSTICLFDVDGTLTAARQVITPEMEEFLEKLKTKVVVGLVGGSDLVKIVEQMGGHNEVIKKFDYLFAENGLVGYRNGELIVQQDLLKHSGEEILQRIINFALGYMSKLQLPAKRGTFIEFRSSMINICPVGRSCSQAERNQFVEYDQKHKLREKFVSELYKEFPDAGFKFAIGGQISIDVFPMGWDKTFCLQYLIKDGFKTVHFFGDKTAQGGNDHEIYEDSRTVGHTVKNPSDTKEQITDMYFKS
ncbi:hypothetical protein LOTGIDRAFT_171717 [Lottia gigantea]|uniref:Phosphomannomutase n=1 Tax=Lottia gigantea TaxID=225164 RepID=V4BAW4_LOTGI|nr:hypothetical protein LOTGIDRAFT_171717 [Lottia gigantea]ESP03112.1 hypothetical protein LOTGIDRAFT_171717 [Lottia gigantea]